VETAVSEIRLLLTENMWTKFSSVMTDVPEFQRDIMFMMVERAGRLVFAVREELCDHCGPRSEDDGYKVTIACKGCGADKTVEFS
jgi:ribosomal protein L37E